MAIEGRPENSSELDKDGYPTPYVIFATTGRTTSYCWEIEYAGIGVTGDNQVLCLATWLSEYKDETGNDYTPPRNRQLSLAF